MAITVEFRFPLGRYHATPWDAAANSGFVEWPPSPWRIMRALVAVAHARRFDVDSVVGLLGRLGNPSAFEAVPLAVGSTRHYLPGVKHRSDVRKDTDLVLDAFAVLDTMQAEPHLRVHWDVDLAEDDRRLLASLIDNLAYLGRSESICDAEVAEPSGRPDESWWRLGESGDDVEKVELLSADGPPDRTSLEATPTAVRAKLRAVYPPGTRLVVYGRHRDDESRSSIPSDQSVRRTAYKPEVFEAVRLQLLASVPIRFRDFLMSTDATHGLFRKAMAGAVDQEAVSALIGKGDNGHSRGNHAHVHVIALPDSASDQSFSGDTPIDSIVLWSPGGIPDWAVDALGGHSRLWTSERIAESSFPTQRLLFAGVGAASDVAGELVRRGGSVRWRSATPYFPVRHRRREAIAEWIRLDVAKELGYRPETAGIDVVDVTVSEDRDTVADLVRFRRRRLRESRDRSRRGFIIEITLSAPVTGPLLLGQLSHFGAGLFVPLDR
ncbi:MAG: type I-U CRISPR-associated protein Csb2 [Actinomycetota bacterium]|nr:type I-U CRISPR-associated protein Csb2 [Actinomycetota bacterium]